MALSTAGKSVKIAALAAASTHISLDTDASGTESTAGRQACSWQGSGDTRDLVAALNFTGGAAGGPATHAGLRSASSGGTFYGSIPLTGDTAFNSLGELQVTELTMTDD